jgi:hypothetical protein
MAVGDTAWLLIGVLLSGILTYSIPVGMALIGRLIAPRATLMSSATALERNPDWSNVASSEAPKITLGTSGNIIRPLRWQRRGEARAAGASNVSVEGHRLTELS